MASKRMLPPWMNREIQFGTDYSEEQVLPVMKLPQSCKVIYSHNEKDCSLLCAELSKSMKLPTVVGFDTEWKPSYTSGRENKIAIVQLCPSLDRCYIFQVSKMGFIPKPLQDLVQSSQITKVDLGELAKSLSILSDKKWGLQSLTKRLFNMDIDKSQKIRTGNWEDFPLTCEQLNYAALDAYASLFIYEHLQKLKKTMEQKP
ncbi:bifunctional 3'-5' exonuclease/ATP-dependent helicase WRN-like [Clavelina lepadiformis]|uniref:bifunctional 3'-5' exonuclease/ATP-dependent helicase WRN-like n=1 Tax=Clavelina lepadiformis TaxID=159417 RepID=UPI0040427CAD